MSGRTLDVPDRLVLVVNQYLVQGVICDGELLPSLLLVAELLEGDGVWLTCVPVYGNEGHGWWWFSHIDCSVFLIIASALNSLETRIERFGLVDRTLSSHGG